MQRTGQVQYRASRKDTDRPNQIPGRESQKADATFIQFPHLGISSETEKFHGVKLGVPQLKEKPSEGEKTSMQPLWASQGPKKC